MESDLRIDSNLMPLQVSSEDDEQLPPLPEMLPIRGNITPQIIEEIETDLEFYEQVALVFLLYDNVDYALQQFKVKLAARNGRSGFSGLLSEWAYQQQGHSSIWEEKFLEGLCIIQNFSVVEKLGYRRDDVEDLFLSGNRDAALNIDLMRKALYVVCEKLTKEQEKRFLELVKEDLDGISSPSFINNAEFLEMHFLFWISQHYIQVQNNTVDVKNITKHLKSMELYSIVDYLESIARRYQTHDDTPASVNEGSLIDEEDNESSYENGAPAHSDVGSVFEENTTVCNEAFYSIDPKNIGFCVIINQKNFYKEPNPKLQRLLPDDDLENRVGTDIDRDRLSEAFGNFGFKVKIWEDLDHVNLLRSVDEAVHDLVEEKHSCFVLCILSHGLLNEVYGVNSIPVSVDDIHMKIQGKNCPKLINKPKIIIIQACQGPDKQDALVQRIPSSSDLAADGPTQSRTSPEVSDSLICWSTVPGYASFRDRITGTWFIQTLCDVLLESTTGVDLNDVLVAVNGKLKCRVANIHKERKTMQPVFSSTLCKKLFWPINTAARKTVAEIMTKRVLFDAYVDEYLRMEFHRNNV